MTARALATELRVSQPTASRTLGALGADVLRAGRGRATHWFAARPMLDLGRSAPIFVVGDDGKTSYAGRIHGVFPGYWVDAKPGAAAPGGHFEDLPYFLDDLRPSGFLGRLVSARHPELVYPGDVRIWTADQCLGWASRHGWNLPGNLIVGDAALALYARHAENPPDLVDASARADRYATFADDALAGGVPGSSAGGEQPKLLVTRADDRMPLLVKFSPPVRDATTQRIADLLLAEHLTLQQLRARGRDGARSTVLLHGERVFLEVERYDRRAGGGRRGVVSWFALDAEFVGSLRSWPVTAAALLEQGRIDDATADEVRWRHTFGRLIANDDMHGGNLAIHFDGARPTKLAPIYDMAPAAYAPRQGHMRDLQFELPPAEGVAASTWVDACETARTTWLAIAADARVSEGFRRIAAANAEIVGKGADVARFLPGG